MSLEQGFEYLRRTCAIFQLAGYADWQTAN